MRRISVFLLALIVLGGCTGSSAAPVIKLGVIAPFEGEGRPLGYAILPAVKQVVAAANQRKDFESYRVLVVAFNDDLDSDTAARQAQALAVDSDVLAVLGPFTPDAIASVQPILTEVGLVSLPVVSDNPTSKDQSSAVMQIQEAAGALLQALAADIAQNGEPTRAGLAALLNRP